MWQNQKTYTKVASCLFYFHGLIHESFPDGQAAYEEYYLAVCQIQPEPQFVSSTEPQL